MSERPLVSVIVPVYSAEKYLERCLLAVEASRYRHYEVIVVNDGSTDASAQVAAELGAVVLQMPSQSGPAAARNRGAQKAQGDILFFVDSDVLIQEDTIERIVFDFLNEPEIGALFGSYDDTPADEGFCSQYKNLQHHYVHQHGNRDAFTFWTGCGAIRREVFHEAGGFDSEKYPVPSIEDIELGQRLRAMGYRILLDKDLQVKHLKRWRFIELIRTDVFQRAIPWSKLLLEKQEDVCDLNLKIADRISAGLVCLSAGILPFALLQFRFVYLTVPLILTVAALNRKLHSFFLKRRGLRFALMAFPLHLFYYLYSSAAYALCWTQHQFRQSLP